MFTPRRCLKVEYVDSLCCSKFGHFSSLRTRTYQWNYSTCNCTCERVEPYIHAWEFVCVNNEIYDSFIVLEHAWVIHLCQLIALLTCMFLTWECWSFSPAWVIDLCWSIGWYMYVLFIWRSWFILQGWKGDVDKLF